jgi:hypothetical protein
VLCLTGTLPASLLTYMGAGADLNLAPDAFTPGVTTFTIPVSDLYLVNMGDSVAVTLTGLQYPYAGDLQATLTLKDNLNNVLASGDIFNRIGKTSNDPNDFGYGPQFGDSSTICSGNYVFDSGFTSSMNDLWATAAPLGSSDSIPCGNYWPTTMFSSANDSLSTEFGGKPINGQWILTIADYYPPGPTTFTPGITSWGLAIQATGLATAPEPSAAIPIALSLGLLGWMRRRKR